MRVRALTGSLVLTHAWGLGVVADAAQTSRDLFGLHLGAGRGWLVRENQSQTEPGQWVAAGEPLAVRATAVRAGRWIPAAGGG
eukprot:3932691-Rhodomonas_salina.3